MTEAAHDRLGRETREPAVTADRESKRCVYLDVSALCRPFDDQNQMRIRLETDAVMLILGHVRSKALTLVVSPTHDVEVQAIEDPSE
jgi:hypothetical protein